MNKTKLFIGEPIRFENKLSIYPPTVGDIVSNDLVLKGYYLFTQSQEDIIDLLNKQKDKKLDQYPTPLEFLLANAYNSKEFSKIATNFLNFILREQSTFVYENKMIVVGSLEEVNSITSLKDLRSINSDNFFDFQNVIRTVFGNKKIEPYKEEDPLVAKIKAKARERERRVAAQKQNHNVLVNSILSVCFMDCGVTPFNVKDLPYCALNQLIKTYQIKEKYEKDVALIIGGADPKKVKPKYWLKEINELTDEVTLKNLDIRAQG